MLPFKKVNVCGDPQVGRNLVGPKSDKNSVCPQGGQQ